MQSFFGFVNTYSDYVAEITDFTSTLYDFIAARIKHDLIQLTADHVTFFEEIKRRLCAAPYSRILISSARSFSTMTLRKSLSVQSS